MDVEVDLARFRVQGPALIHPVILSGGAGTRLWPLSRAAYPKQLLSLLSEQTMLQETALRGMSDMGFAPPLVICNDEHRFLIDEQLRQVGVVPQQILLEPVARNTGPAVTVAALWLAARDPDAVMLVQPSDHVIGSTARFHEAVARGVGAAQLGKLVTFGVRPDRPDTGYGYIQAGEIFDGGGGAAVVDRFVEKPDHAAALRFVDSGVFWWNSGIFLFCARHYLADLARLNPAMLSACERAVRDGAEDLGFFRLDAAALSEAPSLSIDRAVMEHTGHAVVVPVDMAWSDVGSWQSLRLIGPRDADGNVVEGDVILDRVRNSYIRSDNKLIAAIDLEDVVVVSTDDAILVARARSAADVAGVVERLRHSKRPELLQHTTTHRPWGHYRTIEVGNRYQVKRITVKPGAKLSLQKHYHRAEHWIVVQGTAMVQCGGERSLVRENESVYIPIGTEHRLENPGKLPLYLIEVQSGTYLGEDDIVRIADHYGRT
jgi:mannose-1-phosphate guanylyltransferase/mannose-6-phosphate isomerase